MFAPLSKSRLNAFARQFAQDGIVRIDGVLDEGAASALLADLSDRDDWRQVLNSGDKLFELDRPLRSTLSPEKVKELDSAVYAGARTGFQYRYESIRVPDSKSERQGSCDMLAALANEMSGGAALEAWRGITGAADIEYADAQGTAYSAGDFLTGHDDSFEGKNRRAAYVLSLTPVWRLEWGGLLVMHGEDDGPARAYMPLMNVMTIFRVGQMHSVSEVTRAAAFRRYSVTGWLRAEPQPK